MACVTPPPGTRKCLFWGAGFALFGRGKWPLAALNSAGIFGVLCFAKKGGRRRDVGKPGFRRLKKGRAGSPRRFSGPFKGKPCQRFKSQWVGARPPFPKAVECPLAKKLLRGSGIPFCSPVSRVLAKMRGSNSSKDTLVRKSQGQTGQQWGGMVKHARGSSRGEKRDYAAARACPGSRFSEGPSKTAFEGSTATEDDVNSR